MRKTVAVVFALLLIVALVGCDILFPTSVDPCPTPPEQHPEAWTAVPVKTPAGDIVAWTYVCSAGITVR